MLRGRLGLVRPSERQTDQLRRTGQAQEDRRHDECCNRRSESHHTRSGLLKGIGFLDHPKQFNIRKRELKMRASGVAVWKESNTSLASAPCHDFLCYLRRVQVLVN